VETVNPRPWHGEGGGKLETYYLSAMESKLRDLLSKDVRDIPLDELLTFDNLPLRLAVDFGPLKWWWSPRANRGWVYEKIMRRSLKLHLPFDGHDATHLPLPDLAHYFKSMDETDGLASFPNVFNGLPTFVSYFYPSQLSSTVGFVRGHPRRDYLQRMHELESVYLLMHSYYNNWVENGRAFALPPKVLEVIRVSGILQSDIRILGISLILTSGGVTSQVIS